jgi:DNA-binding MarR family transcriptional regulator
VQATTSGALASREAQDPLSRDMYALMNHLMRVTNLQTFGMIAELDLSFTQIKALCALDTEREERSVKALAESMGVSLPAMSRAVDDLYERGFVDRQEDRIDRRMKRVRLTPAGEAMTNSLAAGRLSGIREFLDSLSEEQASALAHALELILAGREDIAALRPARAQAAKRAGA